MQREGAPSKARQFLVATPMRPHTTPFTSEKSIIGVLYGVLMWVDMNAANWAWGTLYFPLQGGACGAGARGERQDSRSAGMVHTADLLPLSFK